MTQNPLSKYIAALLLLLITWACQPDPEPNGEIRVTVTDPSGEYIQEGELTVYIDSVFAGSYDFDRQFMGDPPTIHIPGKPGNYILQAEGGEGSTRYKGSKSFYSNSRPMAVEVQLMERVQ
jgi:hypothetical protein